MDKLIGTKKRGNHERKRKHPGERGPRPDRAQKRRDGAAARAADYAARKAAT